jgi:Transposase DDE domain group 1
VSATQYGETVWSELFSGSRPSVTCLEPAVLAVETAFDLAPQPDTPKTAHDLAFARRTRTHWRLDGGFGTDEKLRWLLARGYQVTVKGFSGRRADNLAKQVQRWTPFGDAWIGTATSPFDYGRPVCLWVKRWSDKGEFHHSFYLTTLKLHSLSQAMQLYNQRGATEIEQFRTDKQGLHLSARRKHGFLAQKALILLNDLGHNLLADFYHTALADSPFAGFAAKRIVRDLFSIEGNLVWQGKTLKRIELCQDNPNAAALLDCLVRYCSS